MPDSERRQFSLAFLFYLMTGVSFIFALAAFDVWLCELTLFTLFYVFLAIGISQTLDRFHLSSISYGAFGGLAGVVCLNLILSLGGGFQGWYRLYLQLFLSLGMATAVVFCLVALFSFKRDFKYWQTWTERIWNDRNEERQD